VPEKDPNSHNKAQWDHLWTRWDRSIPLGLG
jgi:hypothetical protein